MTGASAVAATRPHNDIDLNAINPAVHIKYSPNLHAFLKSLRKSVREYQRVFKDAEGCLWLGYVFDGEFTGQRLNRVMQKGARTQVFTFCGMEVPQEVTGFWAEYTRIGRCAIDPKHTGWFQNESKRWVTENDCQSCTWCGAATKPLAAA